MRQLPERLEELVAALESVGREDRIAMLIEIAGQFQPVPPRIAQRPFAVSHRVPGCESEAYIWAEEMPDGGLEYHFAVENPQGISAMALGAILQQSLPGAPVEQVAAMPADVVYRIFGRELSMGKSLGLMGMVNMVRSQAAQRLRAASADKAAQ